MSKTYQYRILNILYELETKYGSRLAIFDRSLASKRFKRVSDIHGTVMRIARKMAEENLLKRVGRGKFKLTPKGRKAVNAY